MSLFVSFSDEIYYEIIGIEETEYLKSLFIFFSEVLKEIARKESDKSK